ncbi:MAG: hypothetical protein KDC87_13245 [Planctomycetes bacterium]|nr:hypothetical protein [Planctomycetota bacterium]MCB9872084.1 hypothetical protein [Planctomycetota bacterium]
MSGRLRTLVSAWLMIDFFAESRRTGEPGSSLTTTVFGQSFLGLILAAVFLPEQAGAATGYLTANLSLSTLMVGIGLLGNPVRAKRELADELLVQTAPLPPYTLAMARAAHGAFYIALVTTGMAIPPAILAYWACSGDPLATLRYLAVAPIVAGCMVGALSVFTRFVHLIAGPARAQLLGGTLKMMLLGGGFAGFAVCLPHLGKTVAALPVPSSSVLAWPPYWAARIVADPLHASGFALALGGLALLLLALGTALDRMRRRRTARRRRVRDPLARLDHWLAGEGPLLGITRFVATMLYRSPGFRGRVLPLFGMPAAMVVLSLWDLEAGHARALLLGMTLQFPAIFLPFLVGFLPRTDHERAQWVFDTAPAQDLAPYRTASLIALTSHVLVPVHLVAMLALLAIAFASRSMPALWFAVSLPVFSLGLGVLVAELCLTSLDAKPFTRGGEDQETMALGGLTTITIVLALAGGAFSMVAQHPAGLLGAATLVTIALARIRIGRNRAQPITGPSSSP